MHHKMVEWGGIGLSGPQVGRGIAIVTINTIKADSEWGRRLTLTNPIIIQQSAEMFAHNESCLSYPGINVPNSRNEGIVVKYMDLDGNVKEEAFHGLTAFCLQHEIDHLKALTLQRFLDKPY